MGRQPPILCRASAVRSNFAVHQSLHLVFTKFVNALIIPSHRVACVKKGSWQPKTATASDLADSCGPPLQPPIVLPSYERMMLRCETTYRRPVKSNKWTTPQTVAHAASIKSNITTPDLDLARRSRREGVTSIRAAGRSAVDFAPPTGLRYWPSPQSLRVCSLFV